MGVHGGCSHMDMYSRAGHHGRHSQRNGELLAFTRYGIGSLLLILSLPEHASSMLLPLLATYWTSTELLGQRWFNATLHVNGTAKVRLDAEGRRRRISVVDCSCEGGNIHHGHANIPGCYNVSVEALCTQEASRTMLLEHVIQTRSRMW